jgi:hypothetical protein
MKKTLLLLFVVVPLGCGSDVPAGEATPVDAAAPEDSADTQPIPADVPSDLDAPEPPETAEPGDTPSPPDAGEPDSQVEPDVPAPFDTLPTPDTTVPKETSAPDVPDSGLVEIPTPVDIATPDASLELPEECTNNFDSISSMPTDCLEIDLETCAGALCCAPGGAWLKNKPLGCKETDFKDIFSAHGITLTGGFLTEWVTCITGNADAPTFGHAIHVGATLQPAPGKYALQFEFAAGVTIFGLTAAPSASTSQPEVVLRGYNELGEQVGYDTFDFAGFPTGGCEDINPLVQFFGFRSCSGTMTRIVAEFTDPNVAVDQIMAFPP